MSTLPTRVTGVAVADTTEDKQLPARSISSISIRESVSTIVPYANYAAQRAGKSGVAGLALLFFSLIAFFSTNIPLHEQLAERESDLAAARARMQAERAGTVRQTPAREASNFVRALPTVEDVPAVMASVVTIAAASGIELERGTYEYLASDGDSIAHYQMSLPVTGTYPEVREFVENLLATVPAIALESMRIERGKVTDQVISADLRFSVLLGGVQ